MSDECAVCLSKFNLKDEVVPLSCNLDHVFHLKCMLDWADHSYKCPICRQPVIESQQEINQYEVMQQRN